MQPAYARASCRLCCRCRVPVAGRLLLASTPLLTGSPMLGPAFRTKTRWLQSTCPVPRRRGHLSPLLPLATASTPLLRLVLALLLLLRRLWLRLQLVLLLLVLVRLPWLLPWLLPRLLLPVPLVRRRLLPLVWRRGGILVLLLVPLVEL